MRPAGDRLATGWRPAGDRLATGWRPAGDRLATGWRPAGDRLATGNEVVTSVMARWWVDRFWMCAILFLVEAWQGRCVVEAHHMVIASLNGSLSNYAMV